MAGKFKRYYYKSIVEGRAVLRLMSQDVFYNPVQEFNRDLSIAVLNIFTQDFVAMKKQMAQKVNKSCQENDEFAEEKKQEEEVEINILEALSATGLRSVRYAKEVINITKIIANDISQKAVETIQDNIEFNNVDHIVEISNDDACLVMYKHKHPKQRFTAIDLDPYGCPTKFLDGAVQSVADGGLLLVTATDMAVMAGNSPEACYSKYGAVSIKTMSCHEMALRILLQCIEAHANKYSRYIVPLLSVSADFYVRVFVKVFTGARECNMTTGKLSWIYRCVGCQSMTLQPLGVPKSNCNPNQKKLRVPLGPPVGPVCENCDKQYQLGGPIWSGPLHDDPFVERVLQHVADCGSQYGTQRRLLGVLSVISEEISTPLYYTPDRLCGILHSGSIPALLFRSAILNAGYRVSFSHACKNSIKTDAPNNFIWDILRTWINKTFSEPTKKMINDPLTMIIISKPITYDVDLGMRSDADPHSRRVGYRRYQVNPMPYWGPGVRSTVNDDVIKMWKSRKNQNKNSKKKMDAQQKRHLSPPDDEKSRKRIPIGGIVIDTASDGANDEEYKYAACYQSDDDVGNEGTPAEDRSAKPRPDETAVGTDADSATESQADEKTGETKADRGAPEATTSCSLSVKLDDKQ